MTIKFLFLFHDGSTSTPLTLHIRFFFIKTSFHSAFISTVTSLSHSFIDSLTNLLSNTTTFNSQRHLATKDRLTHLNTSIISQQFSNPVCIAALDISFPQIRDFFLFPSIVGIEDISSVLSLSQLYLAHFHASCNIPSPHLGLVGSVLAILLGFE
jgi:hypothetical protein